MTAIGFDDGAASKAAVSLQSTPHSAKQTNAHMNGDFRPRASPFLCGPKEKSDLADRRDI